MQEDCTETNVSSFRPKNANFVPDKRCSGWWTANIIEFIGPNGRKLVSCSKVELDSSLNNNIKNLLDVYCRYRIYAHDSGLLMMSVREEDVDHVCDALYNFRLERPKPEHFLCTTIGSERAPYLRDMVPEIRDLLHNYDFKRILASKSVHPEAIIQRNYVYDMIDCLTKRIMIDYPEQNDRDDFMKSMCSQLLTNPCECTKKCIWECYQSIWKFQKIVEKKLSLRSEEDTELVFGKYYDMTEKELRRRLRKSKMKFVKEIGGKVSPYEKAAGLLLDVLPDDTDNQPLRNADVYYGRGIYLSQSTTYPNWEEKKDEENVKEESSESREKEPAVENVEEQPKNQVEVKIQKPKVVQNRMKLRMAQMALQMRRLGKKS
ncbi:hypothetical protein CAEBREN_00510 [Caenorhabditis brenneri]|uniref:Uncharacterized protein n=1 Tax=Caenorhabditis brenneri TaxID=135651 RepID=G0MHY4_CAEBE|nr:hypothetical protein CAEBREN_00510 [Caenorhabditis brenneri]